jgi:GNAT superfamily N-acetyltransferase
VSDIRIEQLDPADLPQVGDVSVRAFDDYPFMAELFPGPPGDPRRAAVARRFFTPGVADCLAHGVVDAAMDGERLTGFCAWLEPGAYPLSLRRSLPFAPMAGVALRHYPARARLGIQGLVRMERHHPNAPPHWYLAAIAVDPHCQGRGVGAQLIAPGLDRADTNGQPAFLETTRPSARDWYARLGFAVRTEVPAFSGGPPQWFQWRDPA